MKNKNKRWLVAWILFYVFINVPICQVLAGQTTKDKPSTKKEVRSLIAPRMDYDQWTPLGRGDPLKNDPTYDYVPPVLDNVQYWIDPASRKPDTTLPTDTQKTEVLILGVSSKKPSTGTSLTIESKKDTYDPLFFKFVDAPKLGMQNTYQRMSRPHNPAPYSYNAKTKHEQRIPYTILMPPPVLLKRPSFPQSSTTEVTTGKPEETSQILSTSSPITIQNANLLYHSSTLGNIDEFRQKGLVGSYSTQVTWRTPPNSNNFIETQNIPHVPSGDRGKQDSSHVMHKGQVVDGDMDISNSYVNIGKPEAQMHSPNDMELASVSLEPPQIPLRKPPIIIQPTHSLEISPMTLQTLQTMQTMKVPTFSRFPLGFTKSTNSLHGLLRKEITATQKPVTEVLTVSSIFTTTSPPTTATTTTTLTTDPLFKHYKQPVEPLKGPMYLIIQGHSKVKTYGPGKQIHGISIRESNEIPTADEYNDTFLVKHLHPYKKDNPEHIFRHGRSNSLQNLSQVVETGFGAINVNDISVKNEDAKETELVVRYDVASRNEATTEKYYKGIVEAGDMARNMKTE